jgi:hypothetical protein
VCCWDQQLVIRPTSGSAPSAGVPDTRTVVAGFDGGGARVGGLARFSGAVALAGQSCTIEAARSPRGIHHRNAAGRVARCAPRYGGGRVGELQTGWLRCWRLDLPPGPAYQHVTSGARRLACGHPAIPGRDHRIVAWAPGRVGLVGNGRAPRRGRPPAQPRVRSFCPPGHLLTDGVGGERVDCTGAGSGARTAFGAGCRDGTPSRALHDQVDPWVSGRNRTAMVST